MMRALPALLPVLMLFAPACLRNSEDPVDKMNLVHTGALLALAANPSFHSYGRCTRSTDTCDDCIRLSVPAFCEFECSGDGGVFSRDACVTTNLVGSCVSNNRINRYYSPTYTAASARAICTQGVFVEAP